jgi:2-phosphosulfolactate phosphatase
MTVDAVLHPSEFSHLAKRGLEESVCVVFDVLRATSSMVTGLSSGVSRILPARSIEEALKMRVGNPGALLGGERHGDRIEGFDLGNSPAEYLSHPGATIISTTTNGTIALRACASATKVLVGALLNLTALVRAIEGLKPVRLIAVCSGTGSEMSLEDAWAVGAFLKHFQEADCTDAARVAIALVDAHPDVRPVFRSSSNGRALLAKQRLADVEWCEMMDRFETVGVLEDGVIHNWRHVA